MATLTAAGKDSIVLEEGKILTIVGDPFASGVAYKLTDSSGANANKSYAIAANSSQNIGPFNGATEIMVLCNAGTITTTVASAWLTALQYALDANGNPTGLKSPNGGVAPIGKPAPVSGLVALSGDSRASFGGFTSALAQGAATAYHNGFFTQLTALTGGTLAAWPVAAFTAIQTGDLLTRQLPLILASSPRPQVVFDLCDVNDFYSGVKTSDFVIAQKMQFWRALAEAGIVCVELNSTPVGPAASNYSAPKQVQHIAYVQWVNANFAKLFPSHVLVDSYSIAMNPDYTAAPGFLYDDIHPNYNYARQIAAATLAAYSKVITFTNAISPRSVNTLDNALGGTDIVRNAIGTAFPPALIGTTSLPANVTQSSVSNSATTYAFKQSASGLGVTLQATMTFTAAGNSAIMVTSSFAAGSRIRASDIWIPSAVVDVESGQSIIKGIDVRGMVTDGTNTKYSFGGGAYANDTTGIFNPVNLSQEVIVGTPMSFGNTVNGAGVAVNTDAINSCTTQVRVITKAAGVVVIDIAEFALWVIPPQMMDLSGVVGSVTSNTQAGRISVAAAATSVIVTNNRVTAQSRVSATIATNDATASIKNIVAAAGSFTINLASTTGVTVINWKIDA